MKFRIVEHWNTYLDRIPDDKKDIYYTEEYTKLYESQEDRVLCVIGEDDDKVILMPFLRRKKLDYFDFETPYGYGGPITNSSSAEWIKQALEEMTLFFKNEGYICGFIRFHPLLENALLCKDSFNVIYDRKTIAIDMNKSIEEIWTSQISSKNRNMIRKAEKSGLHYKADYDFNSMSQFTDLYVTTMKRLNVDDFYFFSDEYFQGFIENLKGKAFLGTVLLDDKIVGAALFMYMGGFGHYHLAGSNREKGNLGINNYLLWKTIEEFSGMNLLQFHLGGGTSSLLDDSLYKFKRAFSRNEKDFYIGKWIFDNKLYEEICEEWRNNYPYLNEKYGNLLLKYRYRK